MSAAGTLPAGSRPSAARERIPSLDGIRAVAIGFVLFCHTSGTRFFPSFQSVRQYAGNFGVRIFFVLSGFLITTLLLQELAKTGSISLKWFYIRRVFRIFPAAYTYILVFALLTAAGMTTLHYRDLLHALTYTVNYQRIADAHWDTGHLWSLSVEEQFYLLWPAALAFAGRKRALRAAAAAIVVVPVFRFAVHYWLPTPHWSYGFETNADTLAAGCVLAGIRERLAARPGYLKFLSSRWFLAVPLAGVVGYASQPYPALVLPLGFTVMNLSIALCIDRCVRISHDPVGRFLNWRPMTFLGVISYSLYLWQEPFLNRLRTTPTSWFPLNLICAAALAMASYYLVETPLLKVRKRLEKASAGARMPAARCAAVAAEGGQA